MIETSSLILDKAEFPDWEELYKNVWSRPESAKYMAWTVTTNEADAQARMRKVMDFQDNHDAFLVYEKSSGKAIGFAGVEQIAPCSCQETGICLGPEYVGKGYGKQILQGLMQYCKRNLVRWNFFTLHERKMKRQISWQNHWDLPEFLRKVKMTGAMGMGINYCSIGWSSSFSSSEKKPWKRIRLFVFVQGFLLILRRFSAITLPELASPIR